jgi:YidC/Oxa1 family membrane protein insertase
MSFITGIWNSFLQVVVTALQALHDVLEPMFGFDTAWGWAIIGLTLIVRTLLLPLAIKQIQSMRGMQAIQPRVKEIQEKYKVDRDLLKKDPERYQKLKAQQNEKLMALYKEEGVNPASSCLPLLLQMPIFFALFRVLGDDSVEGLANAKFYFFTSFVSDDATFEGLGASVSEAGWPGWLLILLMAGTMFLTQRQMQSRNAAEGAQATQMKVMMYVFPVFLAVISFNFPLAVVLYWVTTNLWQSVQQYLMFRTVDDEEDEAGRPGSSGTGRSTSGDDNGSGSTSKTSKGGSGGSGSSGGGSKGTPNGSTPKRDSGPKKKKSPSSGGATHLPRRRT